MDKDEQIKHLILLIKEQDKLLDKYVQFEDEIPTQITEMEDWEAIHDLQCKLALTLGTGWRHG